MSYSKLDEATIQKRLSQLYTEVKILFINYPEDLLKRLIAINIQPNLIYERNPLDKFFDALIDALNTINDDEAQVLIQIINNQQNPPEPASPPPPSS